MNYAEYDAMFPVHPTKIAVYASRGGVPLKPALLDVEQLGTLMERAAREFGDPANAPVVSGPPKRWRT